MKNHELRPIGSQSFPELNANTNTNSGLIEEGRSLWLLFLWWSQAIDTGEQQKQVPLEVENDA